MVLGKRKRVSSSRAYKTARRVGNVSAVARARGRARVTMAPSTFSRLSRQVRGLSRMIETKEGTRTIRDIQLGHNRLTVFSLNPFLSSNGTADPMDQNTMNRIGDQISVRGLKIKFFIETSLQRSNVHFKFYLVRMAKGDTLDTSTFFKGAANNKMIDQINTERFSILGTMNARLTCPNAAPASIATTAGVPSTSAIGIGGTKIIQMWVPGRKFGRRGLVQYEPQSQTQVKFFDYRLCAVAYDWYATADGTVPPVPGNNVGFVNEGYMKLYFKDA